MWGGGTRGVGLVFPVGEGGVAAVAVAALRVGGCRAAWGGGFGGWAWAGGGPAGCRGCHERCCLQALGQPRCCRSLTGGAGWWAGSEGGWGGGGRGGRDWQAAGAVWGPVSGVVAAWGGSACGGRCGVELGVGGGRRALNPGVS